jgi:hypothetical protein
MTRRSRKVHIEELEEHDLPLEPGQTKPVKAQRWRGTLYMMDGVTKDTIKWWSPDGGADSLNGVATPDDLAILISEDPQLAVAITEVPSLPAPKAKNKAA